MTSVVRAWLAGMLQVLRAPLLIALALALTLATAVPFAVVLRSQLQAALAHQPPVDLGSGEVDADWWAEFRRRADGLAATFTPTIIGFAAPLDNLSSLLDGTPRPAVLAIPVAITLAIWALLWGVVLRRFDAGRGLSIGEGVRAGFSNLPRFVLISVVAGITQLLLYFTIHRALFGGLYPALVARDLSEPAAFAVRVVLYVAFGSLLVVVSLVADYARIAQVVVRPAAIGEMFGIAAGFIRRRFGHVVMLYLLTGVLFAGLMTAYGIIDIAGGSRVGGWRGIAIGQAFICGRLFLRLLFGASELQLFKAERAQSS